ncbi:alpha/beta hydrolase [Paenochrobactrum sp. BZR 588]|uniref:alpha/beta hydrolase n=1 Tax=unclassified Paenochrobactrum TaxID=2639760 RepID=UPI00385237F1
MQRDWNEEFANSAYIPGSEILPELWANNAADYRASMPVQLDIAYGDAPRNLLDLVFPEGTSKGLVVFVHGGFWTECSKSDWTDLAEGMRLNGWTVAIPGYTLAPNAKIFEIVGEITAAITKAAALIAGPIKLVGHSAGGHLVTRMICQNSLLDKAILARIQNVMSISGVHDLRLLQKTRLNEKLRLDDAEAECQSPVLLRPLSTIPVTCWVGANERPEFIRQSRLLAMIWDGMVPIKLIEEVGHNHYSILENLKKPASALVRELLASG